MPETEPILWVIFSFSFLVALTGAMAPGPLMTYTIIESARTRHRGYLTGFKVILGHAILEGGMILVMLLGLGAWIRNDAVIRGIGLTGGVILVWFGLSIVADVWRGRVKTLFTELAGKPSSTPRAPSERADSGVNPASKLGAVTGGALISMANPYWWVWWATIGLAFMVQYDISTRQWQNLAAFYLGHEAGDLLWYVTVSCLSFFGLRRLKTGAYQGILVTCGVFMVGFGVYLGISPFLNGSMSSG